MRKTYNKKTRAVRVLHAHMDDMDALLKSAHYWAKVIEPCRYYTRFEFKDGSELFYETNGTTRSMSVEKPYERKEHE